MGKESLSRKGKVKGKVKGEGHFVKERREVICIKGIRRGEKRKCTR